MPISKCQLRVLILYIQGTNFQEVQTLTGDTKNKHFFMNSKNFKTVLFEKLAFKFCLSILCASPKKRCLACIEAGDTHFEQLQ